MQRRLRLVQLKGDSDNDFEGNEAQALGASRLHLLGAAGGETYIPGECVADYNETYGAEFPSDDIEFEL